MRFELRYKNQVLGSVEQSDHDFLNVFGTFKPHQNLKQEAPFLQTYIDFSVKADFLLETDEALGLEFRADEEPKFDELIESEDWVLVDTDGTEHSILIPLFQHKNDGIVWRWNH